MSEFLDAYDAVDKTSKRAVSTLTKNTLQESDCFSICSVIIKSAFSKREWS